MSRKFEEMNLLHKRKDCLNKKRIKK